MTIPETDNDYTFLPLPPRPRDMYRSSSDVRELSAEDKELLARAYSRIESANSLLQFLGEHFQKKYGLQFGEQITPNGEIVDGPSLSNQNNSSPDSKAIRDTSHLPL